MKVVVGHCRFAFCILILVLAFASKPAHAQIAPVCGNDPVCTPDPTSSSYPGAVVARGKILNARGYGNRLVAKAPLRAGGMSRNGDETVVGSQSYNYAIPILSLPGRGGLDLNLNLYYNSRVWDVDTVNGTVTFNADRDFPSYGFRLDFGYMEVVSGNTDCILTEGDGTKHDLSEGTDPQKPYMYYSTDGTHIQYNTNTNQLQYKSGLTVQYAAFPSNANLFRPTFSKDSNGNYLSITYVSGHDQLINQITDTLGRVLTFNYLQDGSNRLSSISMPAHPSGTKTFVTFTWGNPYSSGYSWYHFSGLTVNGAPTAAQLNFLTGCTYPNNTGYRFTYEDWGTINKIEHLSSTTSPQTCISYDYPLANAGALTDAPAYTHQTVSPDGGTSNNSVWTYATTKSGTGVVTSMAITDPVGTTSTT